MRPFDAKLVDAVLTDVARIHSEPAPLLTGGRRARRRAAPKQPSDCETGEDATMASQSDEPVPFGAEVVAGGDQLALEPTVFGVSGSKMC